MTLEEFTKTAEPSDRLIIKDNAGHELYKGFMGCLQYKDIDRSRRVKKHSLHTEIFHKEKKKRYDYMQPLGEEIKAENISDFPFADLEMLIYTLIDLRD